VLDVFVMQAAEADAVLGIEWRAALAHAHDVVHLDRSAASLADALEPAAILVAGPDKLPCLLPAG
jgi:hypothetical protein